MTESAIVLSNIHDISNCIVSSHDPSFKGTVATEVSGFSRVHNHCGLSPSTKHRQTGKDKHFWSLSINPTHKQSKYRLVTRRRSTKAQSMKRISQKDDSKNGKLLIVVKFVVCISTVYGFTCRSVCSSE